VWQEAPKTPFGKTKKTYSGKVGGRNDDVVITMCAPKNIEMYVFYLLDSIFFPGNWQSLESERSTNPRNIRTSGPRCNLCDLSSQENHARALSSMSHVCVEGGTRTSDSGWGGCGSLRQRSVCVCPRGETMNILDKWEQREENDAQIKRARKAENEAIERDRNSTLFNRRRTNENSKLTILRCAKDTVSKETSRLRHERSQLACTLEEAYAARAICNGKDLMPPFVAATEYEIELVKEALLQSEMDDVSAAYHKRRLVADRSPDVKIYFRTLGDGRTYRFNKDVSSWPESWIVDRMNEKVRKSYRKAVRYYL
jgi:hypothetical protein